jgi:hypothetical protein
MKLIAIALAALASVALAAAVSAAPASRLTYTRAISADAAGLHSFLSYEAADNAITSVTIQFDRPQWLSIDRCRRLSHSAVRCIVVEARLLTVADESTNPLTPTVLPTSIDRVTARAVASCDATVPRACVGDIHLSWVSLGT